MSGIVGIVNLEGAPVDRELLSAMTQSLAFRGPDARNEWVDGSVGLGHTLLSADGTRESNPQPATLDGKVRIVADARIDGRGELIESLRIAGRTVAAAATDAELILHAYHAWGTACAEHLLGDFAFAIWDGPAQKLYCARDHFGVKPFYYARVGKSFLFSNTIDCLRIHPDVTDTLNDLAVADFLLFGFKQDLDATAFADIQRVPPAHSLECRTNALTVRRYWTLPEAEPVYFKRAQECVEKFREVFDAAVSDRMRSNTACIMLSGGLDSSTVAASAKRVLDRRSGPSDLWAYTHVYENLVPHEEGRFADLIGAALHIPVEHRRADDCQILGDYANPDYTTPEPLHSPYGLSGVNRYDRVAARGRVLFTGLGADPVLASLRLGHLRRRIKAGQFWGLAKDLAAYFSVEGRFSRLYLRGRWHRRRHPAMYREAYPPWINPDLEKRLNLRDRWEHVNASPQPNHSVRPEAYNAIASHQATVRWVCMFEDSDAASTHQPFEFRHPFFDLRVAQFLLALPALPWCSDKEILRRAGRGSLPEAVRLRRKTTMSEDPVNVALRRPESAWVDNFEPASNFQQFVIQSRIPKIFGMQDSITAWVQLRPLTLNFWLQRLQR